MRSSGTRHGLSCVPVIPASCPPLSDRSSKACQDFDSLLGLEAEKEGVIPVPNLAKETLELPPAVIPLGSGLNGKSSVMGSSCSSEPTSVTPSGMCDRIFFAREPLRKVRQLVADHVLCHGPRNGQMEGHSSPKLDRAIQPVPDELSP
ncbi:hypothetical protein MHU86_2618 [Fragilaria crotonensis]|nr:hypothetical protein MHU86_2618 [Fragilaria crotonensis]